MLNFPKFANHSLSKDKIQQIHILSQTLLNFPLQKNQVKHIFHQQLFKSSLFSANIEGNTLTLRTAKYLDLDNPKQKKDQEISNIAQAHQHLKYFDTADLHMLKKLHRVVMKDLIFPAGKIRSETSAIFDQAGNAVYITPDYTELKQMLKVLFNQINKQPHKLSEQLNLALNCHYYYEKIHPFVDGNGRLGRILLHWQLQKFNFIGDYILPIEEYFNIHRNQYYFHLEKNSTNTINFFNFFLDGLIWSLEKQLTEIKNLSLQKPTPNLLPRRQEIVSIVKDHPYSSLDFIARRFPTIARRTIQYDLNQLTKKGFINKHGQTRGVVYTVYKH